MKFIFTIACILSIGFTVIAQEKHAYNDAKKGQFYILWGWNRAFYSKSNIHFKGDDYDFTLYKVKGHDRPTLPITYHDYFEFDRLTIPQTNFKMGYFIRDNLVFSLSDDHMKYVMDQDQTVRMKGTISRPGPHKGDYDGNKKLTTDFLTFEHTNGLNYINAELEKYFSWYHSKNDNCIISGMMGIGAGILFPRTDAQLLDYQENDEFHVSGAGLMIKGGVQGTFFKHLVVKMENKYGVIDMPDILLHKKGINGRARQAFMFAELTGMVGATFALRRKKRKTIH